MSRLVARPPGAGHGERLGGTHGVMTRYR
jgi:hypothetical protein